MIASCTSVLRTILLFGIIPWHERLGANGGWNWRAKVYGVRSSMYNSSGICKMILVIVGWIKENLP